MAYNSYVILDDKIAVMDTVDKNFAKEWLANLEETLCGRKPDYLVVQHMEPDHSANIVNFLNAYPDAKGGCLGQSLHHDGAVFRQRFFRLQKVIAEGDTLELGKHTLNFIAAPMVHWPEVMVTFDSTDKVLFSADGFGKFGALTLMRTGPAKPAATTSALWANTVCRCKICLKRPLLST